MTISSFFLDWKVKLVGFVLLLVLAFSWHKVEVTKQVEAAKYEVKEQTKGEIERKLAEQKKTLKKEADDTQKALEATYDNQLKEKDETYKRINVKYSALLNSLSNHPTRPVQPPSDGKYGLSIPPRTEQSFGFMDGSGLSYVDARLLAGFALRTEGLKVELQSCYKAYDSARDTLERFKSEHQGM